MLASSRATHEPLDPSLMRSAFVQVSFRVHLWLDLMAENKANNEPPSHPLNQIRNTFRPYTRYCLEHTACLSYVKEQNRTNEFFKVYLAVSRCCRVA